MPTPRNPFIVIEALDAGGSQTQTDRLARRLKQGGYTVRQLHFPQEDRATGRLIYEKFLHSTTSVFSRREQALLYLQDFFSRAEDITKALSTSTIVISDRFYTSTFAYQTIGLTGQRRRDVLAWIKWLAEQGTPRLPRPDAVILLDTPVEISLGHLSSKKKDHFENRQKLAAIRRSYLKLAHEKRWHVIPSADTHGRQRSIADIHADVWQYVNRRRLIKIAR